MSSRQMMGTLAIVVLVVISLVIIIMAINMDKSIPPMSPAATEDVAPQGGVTMPETDRLIGVVGAVFLLNGVAVLIYFKTFGYKPLKKD